MMDKKLKEVLDNLKALNGGDLEINGPKREPLVTRLIEEFGWKNCKMNIPEDNESWETGNGEGIWVLAQDPETTEKQYDVVLQNNSIYYFGIITWGCVVTAVNRGNKRPVIDWHKDGHPNLAWMEN